MIAGDGIGKEVIPQAVSVIEAAGAAVEATAFDWGADRYLADNVTVPPDGFAMLAAGFDAILVGAFGDPRVSSNIHAKEILRMRMVINELLVKHCGQPTEKVERDCERDFIMSAQQAKEYGLIDEIIFKHR